MLNPSAIKSELIQTSVTIRLSITTLPKEQIHEAYFLLLCSCSYRCDVSVNAGCISSKWRSFICAGLFRARTSLQPIVFYAQLFSRSCLFEQQRLSTTSSAKLLSIPELLWPVLLDAKLFSELRSAKLLITELCRTVILDTGLFGAVLLRSSLFGSSPIMRRLTKHAACRHLDLLKKP